MLRPRSFLLIGAIALLAGCASTPPLAMLRKDFQEPRIHAALVCAAISCPPLRQEPYTGENLDEQLEIW